ncbi:MAG: BamA/TamA family outer membrane protein [Thermodesulfobacteriota bacterium]
MDSLNGTEKPSKFWSGEDDWLDVSEFLDEKYGFLPVVVPITEPAVGYGGAGGLLFISKPLGNVRTGYERPDLTFVGGAATENGTRGVAAGDMRYWMDGRIQSLAGVVCASVNLDFHGIGEDGRLNDHPLGYTLEPKGGGVQGKYRMGNSRLWLGLSYVYAVTNVSFDEPERPGLPEFERDSDVGGVTPSLTFDTRDNIFTPSCGTYVEASLGLFGAALGSDDSFQRARLIAMQFIPLGKQLFLGIRGEAGASFNDAPFYLRPFIYLRGAPIMRYQGEEAAQIEAELRWQFWKRFSLVGFSGCGAAWNDFERVESAQSIVTGGAGLRYEIARQYGLHMGFDVAFAPENTAFYIQVGSAWARP